MRKFLGDGSSLIRCINEEGTAFEYTLPSDYLGIERTLRITFPPDFPKSLLDIRIEPSPWLEWPHALPKQLCLFGMRQLPINGTAVEIVEETFRRLGKLVTLVMPNSDPLVRRREFEREVTYYWSRALNKTSDQLKLLSRPSIGSPLFTLSETVAGLRSSRRYTLLAVDKSSLTAYSKRMTGISMQSREPATAAFYLPLKTVPDVRFPGAGEIYEWVKEHTLTQDFNTLLGWDKKTSSLPIRWLILCLPEAIEFEGGEPVPEYQSKHFAIALFDTALKNSGNKNYGMRAGRRSLNELVGQRKPPKLAYSQIHVLDRMQVHSRDVRRAPSDFANARVVIIGVGSLGSAVATQLAREGIGNLCLVDPEVLQDANLGRHALGMPSLGYYKSQELCNQLQRDIPTIHVRSIQDYSQSAYLNHRDVFDKADVVISTSADWHSEMSLWDIKAAGAPWTLIQCWSEPYAYIGHLLLAPPGNFDGRKLFDSSGRFHHRMSNWPNDGIHALQGCGTSFIPGAITELASIAAMVSKAALVALSRPSSEPQWHTNINQPDSISLHGGTYIGPTLPHNGVHMSISRPWPSAIKEI